MSEAPERVWLDWPDANRGDVVYDEPPERKTQPGQTCYTRSDLCVTSADLDAAVALALEMAAKQVAMSAPGEWFVRDVDRVHDAIRALIQPHQADALARVRQETWNAAIKAAIAAVPNGWTGKPYQSNIDYGPNTANYARTAIAALALPVDGVKP